MRRLLSVLFLVWLSGTTGAAMAETEGPDAELDRNQIAEGETVVLSLTVPGELDGEPDFSPLEQDFDILGRSQSSHTSIVNGHMSSQRVWRLTLAPKRPGLLTVPPIPVGAVQSLPQGLKVLEAGSQGVGAQAPRAFIEVEAEPKAPYVQGQISYKVRVFYREKLRDGSLSDPKAEGVPVERLGEDKSYREYRNGHRYDVIERRYALFPQHSGPLEIQAPVLSASVLVQSRRPGGGLTQRIFGHDPFGDMGNFFQESRPLRVRGKALTLDVRPRPAAAGGTWLPARDLQLEEHWTPEPDAFRVGEPITRTLTLRARGLTDSQLPDLPPPAVDGLKVYADQPQGETRPVDGGLEAVKQIKAALVPTRPGRFELPEIRIDWWDTLADRARTAVLPARGIQVLPAPTSESNQPPNAGPAPRPEPSGSAEPPAALPSPAIANGPAMPEARYWPWIAAALGAAWLLTLGLWLRERRRGGSGRPRPVSGKSKRPNPSTAAIRQACRSNDPAAARRALLEWAAARWPEQPPAGLTAVGQRLGDPDVREALRGLDAALYASNSTNWDGTVAWERLRPRLKRTDGKSRTGPNRALPELYPQSSH